MLSVLPLLCQEDAATAFSSRVTFVDLFPADASTTPHAVKNQWIGMTIRQPPSVMALVAKRSQDPTTLLEAGRNGLPLLVLSGTKDQIIDGAAVAQAMNPISREWRAGWHRTCVVLRGAQRGLEFYDQLS